MKRHLKPAILIGLAALIALEFFYLRGPSPAEPQNPTLGNQVPAGGSRPNPVRDRAIWTEIIDREGGEVAYRSMLEKYAGQHFGVQHNAAHVMGELLFEKLGIDGFKICDANYSFGCYHSFIGRAFAEHGVSIIPKLDQGCVEKFGPLGTGCQHGIGHGLVEFFGHDRLLDALEACQGTTQQKKLFGCTSGAFMEYNVPIVLDEERSSLRVRNPDPNDIYAPCSTLPEKYRPSCYYEMAQWWDKVFLGDFRKLGDLCDRMPDQEHREECFLGVGNMAAPSSDYEVEGTIAKCDLMPDRVALLLCRSGASWSTFAATDYRDRAAQVCADLSPAEKDRCVKDSDLIGTGEIRGTDR
jgi:hypothetical protein